MDIICSHSNCSLLPEVPPAVLDIARSTLALPLPEDGLASEDTLYTCDRVCKCFKLLRMLHNNYFTAHNCEVLRVFWPDAFRWITYLHANAALYDQGRRYNYVVGLSAVLHGLRITAKDQERLRLQDCPCEHHSGDHGGIFDSGLEDEFFLLTFKVWADPKLPLDAANDASIALMSFQSWTSYRQDVLLHVFDHPDDIAALAFLRLRQSLKDIMQCRRISFFIEIMAFFVENDDASVKAAFVDAGIIRRITKLILKFDSMGRAKTMACCCPLTSCFKVLISLYGGVRRSAMQFALSALHHRVLEALLCTGWINLNTPGDNVRESIAKRYIPRFMCYKSYSAHSLMALANIPDDAYTEYGFPDAPASFKKLWYNLESYITESSILRNLGEMGLNEQKVWCDEVRHPLPTFPRQILILPKQPSCDVSEAMTALKRCAGCRIAFYCSRACQYKAWNAGHRELCPKIAKDIGYSPNGKSERYYLLRNLMRPLLESTKTAQYDKSLVIQIACTTVKRHLKSIKRIAAETFPGRPLGRMMLYIDLKQRPHTMRITPVKRPGDATCRYREHFQYFMDKVLNRIERGCERIVPMSIECANEMTTYGAESSLFVMADIDVDADLDVKTDGRIIRSPARASSLYQEKQRLEAEYDIVDAVLDTMHTMGKDRYKEESIQEAIEVHYGKRAMGSPKPCPSSIEQ